MRIIHVFDHSLPLQSGYVFRSLGILSAQRSFGWETIHLTTPRYNTGSQETETVDGWTFHRTPKPTGRFSDYSVVRELLEIRAVEERLDQLLREQRPDIVHAHSPVLTGIPALRAARRAKIPVVYEVRALWEDAAVDVGNTKEWGLRYRLIRRLETRVLRAADAVVTLCDSMRQELASRGIANDKITVVPNAVDIEHFTGCRQSDPVLARELGLENSTVLGFIGSFYHYEGLDLLLKALPEIRQSLSNVSLVLVGGGPEAENLERLSSKLGLESVVRFAGRVPHGVIGKYYDLINFFIYPRRSIRLTELVTPLKPLEAMAERRIVIASNVGGHREIISDGVTGYLFSAGNVSKLAGRVVEAVQAVSRNTPIRAAARRFVETERTWAASGARYRPVYEALARRSAE